MPQGGGTHCGDERRRRRVDGDWGLMKEVQWRGGVPRSGSSEHTGAGPGAQWVLSTVTEGRVETEGIS